MAMDTKQKVVLTLTIVAFGYLGYQLFELVNHDIKHAQTSPHASVQHIVAMKKNSVEQHPAVTAQSTPQNVTTNKQSQSANVPSAAATAESQAVSIRSQQAYLRLLSEYELARMKHQLLQEQLAIAEAEQKIAKLSGSNAVNNNAVNLSAINEPVGDGLADVAFKLNYLDKQQGKWSATIYHQGRYQTVYQGYQFADGIRVIKISRAGVMLANHQQRELLNFNGIVRIAAPKAKIINQPQIVHAAPTTITKPSVAQASKQPSVVVPHPQLVLPTTKPSIAVTVQSSNPLWVTPITDSPLTVVPPALVESHPVMPIRLYAPSAAKPVKQAKSQYLQRQEKLIKQPSVKRIHKHESAALLPLPLLTMLPSKQLKTTIHHQHAKLSRQPRLQKQPLAKQHKPTGYDAVQLTPQQKLTLQLQQKRQAMQAVTPRALLAPKTTMTKPTQQSVVKLPKPPTASIVPPKQHVLSLSDLEAQLRAKPGE